MIVYKKKKGENTMANFINQIKEDIKEYQERYKYMANISKDEWAFNFWILDKLYKEDEQIIEDKIIDYNDKGVDCYVWHEDTLDLYLIQNKYYSENTALTNDYVQNDFLTRAIGALEKDTYTRSQELQNIYNRYSVETDFSVHFVLYVTNNISKTKQIIDGIARFNSTNINRDATIYGLDDIESLYYDKPMINKKKMSFEIRTINKGTILNIDPEAYKMTVPLDAKYVLVPVINMYEIYKLAKEKDYPIFDSNIREYLGTTGTINKRMVETLKDPNERVNFFYYNNGITIIAENISKEKNASGYKKLSIDNPQIVNGCQTVSTIYETLASLPEQTLEREFKDTYVMLKILKIPKENEKLQTLSNNIVTYNNSQNAINQKAFAANTQTFMRLQIEFKKKGFLLCIKQSDKNMFSKEFKTPTKLLALNSDVIEKFALNNYTKTKDLLIDLEKLLQVILAFSTTAHEAITNKSKLLKPGTAQNKKVTEFITGEGTINDLLNLYLLYLRAEQEKKASKDGRMPIPLYLIDCFGKYECDRNCSKISDVLKDKDTIDEMIKLYKATIQGYTNQWDKDNSKRGYNVMIKSSIDYNILDDTRSMAKSMM